MYCSKSCPYSGPFFMKLGVSIIWRECRLLPADPRESLPRASSLVRGTLCVTTDTKWDMPAAHPVTHLYLLPTVSCFPKFPAHGHHYSSPVHPSGFNAGFAFPWQIFFEVYQYLRSKDFWSMFCQFVVVFELVQVSSLCYFYCLFRCEPLGLVFHLCLKP